MGTASSLGLFLYPIFLIWALEFSLTAQIYKLVRGVFEEREVSFLPATESCHTNMERKLQPETAGGGSSLRYADNYEIHLQNPICSIPAPPFWQYMDDHTPTHDTNHAKPNYP